MIEIPFKKGQRIKHKNNKDVALKIIELIGRDDVKTIIHGAWVTLKTTPSVFLAIEYVVIKNKDIDGWEVI